MFAYVPARGGSKRIPRKNIKTLGGKPILTRVIENLRPLAFISATYISTDDPEIAEAAGAQCLDLRAPHLANDAAGFMDLIREDIPRFISAHGGDDEVLFVLPTAALVPPSIYHEACAVWRKHSPDILMSCEHTFPWWSMVQKPDGFWTPIFSDKVAINSQLLPLSLIDAGLFYFFRQPQVAQFLTVKSAARLMPFLVPDRYLGDIDTPEDWDMLEYRLSRLQT